MARQRTVASRHAHRPPAAGGDAAPVGRDDLLGRLRRAVDEAVAGRGLIVLLTGEAGIGKTTLLKEAARYAEGTGARAAWGWGWPGEGTPGYWPWIQVLRALGLDARMPAGAVSVIGTYRGPDPPPALAAVAARATVLPVSGLTAEAVTPLVADVLGEETAAGVAAEVHGRTGGNPFFVQQVSWLLKQGRRGIPPGVREALAERFAGLPAACPAVLSAAAVVGRRFRTDLVARATARAPGGVAEALAEAAQAGVLTEDAPGAYLFAHDLFREYAYQRLSATERTALHLRAGRQLEADRAHGADVPLAELAGHFVRADPDSAEAHEYCASAAREADGRLAYEEATRHWEWALAAAGQNPAIRTGTLLELAQARWRMGAGQAAGESYLAAARLAR